MNTTKQKQTHRYREQTSGYQRGEGSKEGKDNGRGLKLINSCAQQIVLQCWRNNEYTMKSLMN